MHRVSAEILFHTFTHIEIFISASDIESWLASFVDYFCYSCIMFVFVLLSCLFLAGLFYPRYEVYRGYIVFAFSVIMFVCLSVCLSVNFFFVKDFSATTWVRIPKFGTKLDSDELYPRYEVYRGYIVFAFSVIMFPFL